MVSHEPRRCFHLCCRRDACHLTIPRRAVSNLRPRILVRLRLVHALANGSVHGAEIMSGPELATFWLLMACAIGTAILFIIEAGSDD